MFERLDWISQGTHRTSKHVFLGGTRQIFFLTICPNRRLQRRWITLFHLTRFLTFPRRLSRHILIPASFRITSTCLITRKCTIPLRSRHFPGTLLSRARCWRGRWSRTSIPSCIPSSSTLREFPTLLRCTTLLFLIHSCMILS